MSYELTFISDTHIGHNKYFDMEIMYDVFEDAINRAADTDTKMLIHGGDLFDKIKVGLDELSIMGRVASYAAQQGVIIVINTGNHCLDKDGRSFPTYLNQFDAVTSIDIVAEQPKLYTIGSDLRSKRAEVWVVILPYGGSIKDAIELGTGRGYKKGILVAHTDIRGAKYDNDNISESGWTRKELAQVEEAFDLVLLGHIHMQQWVTNKTYFLGSPLQFNFGAVGQDRGYSVVELDTLTLKSKNLVGSPWPEFHDITYSDLVNMSEEDEYWPNTHLRVAVSAEDMQERPGIKDDEIIALAKKKGATTCKPDREVIVQTVERRTTIRVDDPPETMADKYIRTVIDDDKEIRECLKIHTNLLKQMEMAS